MPSFADRTTESCQSPKTAPAKKCCSANSDNKDMSGDLRVERVGYSGDHVMIGRRSIGSLCNIRVLSISEVIEGAKDFKP